MLDKSQIFVDLALGLILFQLGNCIRNPVLIAEC